MTSRVTGLRDLAGSFDAFIIDLWGVLHDGVAAYPGAIPALEALKAAGKPVLLLSNAPRPAAPLVEQMAALGIVPSLYHRLLSSGEAVRGHLARRDTPFYAGLGEDFYHLGPAFDASLFEGLGYRPVDIETATFILNTGPWEPDETVEDYLPVLIRGAARRLPMVCANPDRKVVRRNRNMVCAGAVADRYVELGGVVDWQGKPDPAIYELSLALLGARRERTLCIGDGLATDIAGANGAEMASLLISGGIHMAELGPDVGRLDEVMEQYGARPDWVMPRLTW